MTTPRAARATSNQMANRGPRGSFNPATLYDAADSEKKEVLYMSKGSAWGAMVTGNMDNNDSTEPSIKFKVFL